MKRSWTSDRFECRPAAHGHRHQDRVRHRGRPAAGRPDRDPRRVRHGAAAGHGPAAGLPLRRLARLRGGRADRRRPAARPRGRRPGRGPEARHRLRALHRRRGGPLLRGARPGRDQPLRRLAGRVRPTAVRRHR
ncbi:hypothetical protein ACFFX0_09335 [Citricoccus parietis]|uniref:Uncharacterized protein n=1 Tax=Citricoccus parietis TaxID=592307 RepID=A0ABV5FXG3_9MICC